jgi:hypothetical protein
MSIDCMAVRPFGDLRLIDDVVAEFPLNRPFGGGTGQTGHGRLVSLTTG